MFLCSRNQWAAKGAVCLTQSPLWEDDPGRSSDLTSGLHEARDHWAKFQTLAAKPRRFLEEEFTLILSAFKNTPSSCPFFPFSISISSRKYNKDSSSHREGANEWERERESVISPSLFFFSPFHLVSAYLLRSLSQQFSIFFSFFFSSFPLLFFSPSFLSVGRIKNSRHALQSFLNTKERTATSWNVKDMHTQTEDRRNYYEAMEINH